MKNLIASIKNYKYKKDLLIVAAVVLGLFLAVGGDGLADIAKKKFWSSLWAVLNVVCFVGAIVGWAYLWNKDRRQAKAEQGR